MSDSTPPKLRPLGISTPLDGSEGAVRLSDPLGLRPQGPGPDIDIPPAEWAILRRFDGERGSSEIAEAATDELGRSVSVAEVDQLVTRASDLLLLEDQTYERALDRAFDEFRRQAIRPAVGPGRDYEQNGFDLRVRIGGLVADEWDLPPLPQAQGLWTPAAPLGMAGPVYSRAWAAVRHCRSAIDRVVLMGSVGAPLDSLLVPLAKPFETPLGQVAVDSEALAALGHLPGRDQLAHRDSLELERQLLFVRLLFPELPVVPLLVSSPNRAVGTPEAWETRECDEVERAVGGLRAVLELEGRTLVIAAADCYRRGHARAGSKLDAPRGTILGGDLGGRIRDADREAIDAATRLDPDGFIAVAFDDEDPARAALAAAPYLMLRTLEGRQSYAPLEDDEEPEPVRGSTLGYLPMPGAGQVSTAAAVVFH